MDGRHAVPGTNRITEPSAEGQCLWHATCNSIIGLEVTRGDDPLWHTSSRPGFVRPQTNKFQKCLAEYVSTISEEEFRKVFCCHPTYKKKEDYVSRLKDASNRSGRQDWGGHEDMQIVAGWLETSSFEGALYAYDKSIDSLTRITKDRVLIRQDPGTVTDNDMVLCNTANTHWMNTVVTGNHYPALEHDVPAPGEVIELDD